MIDHFLPSLALQAFKVAFPGSGYLAPLSFSSPPVTFGSKIQPFGPSLQSGQLYVLSAPGSSGMSFPSPGTMLSALHCANISLRVPSPWDPA